MYFYIILLDEKCGLKYVKLRSMTSKLTRNQATAEVRKRTNANISIDDIISIQLVSLSKWMRF